MALPQIHGRRAGLAEVERESTWFELLWGVGLLAVTGCGDQQQCCSFESRVTCEGANPSEWTVRELTFDPETAPADVDAEGFCDRYQGTEQDCVTECACDRPEGCCSTIEYRNTELTAGACPS